MIPIVKIAAAAALIAVSGVSLFAQSASTVKVSDFGAVPDDGKCDIAAIREAIKYAKETGATRIQFESGTYDLFVEDPSKDIPIIINSHPNLEFTGVCSKNKKPKTLFLRRYDFKPNISGAPILQVQDCPNFKLKNVAFDNFPRYMTCGEVVKLDENGATVKIPDGNPYFDKTVLWCANVWDAKTKNLKKKPSLTFGGKNVEDRIGELTAHIEGDPKDRLLRINSPEIASQLELGEVLSWNFGWLGLQVSLITCQNLHLENVSTYSAIGFCMQASRCRNVFAKNVRFERKGNQMHVGSRDAWKLYSCRGTAVIEDCYFEGVRWDAQNVHGIFGWVEKIIDKKTAMLTNNLYGLGSIKVPLKTKVGFCKNRDEQTMLTLLSYKKAGKAENGKTQIEATFAEDIPDFASKSTVCQFYGMNLDSYTLINSTFRNIAGTASLIRNENANIIGNKFDHIMYPAVCAGGAFAEVEGVNGKNIHIANNTFDTCGWQSRHGGVGAIAVRIQYSGRTPKEQTPFLKDVFISSNTIKNCDVGIDVQDARDLFISGNMFENVGTPILHSNNPDAIISNNIEKPSDK